MAICFNDRSGLSVKMEENKDQLKISGMIAVLSMEEALERANWLLGKKNGLDILRE